MDETAITYPLFCFGSNNPTQLTERLSLPSDAAQAWKQQCKKARLLDHQRVFRGLSKRWGGGTASVVFSKNHVVYGFVAYVTEEQLHILDRREGVFMNPPKYMRSQLDIDVEGQMVSSHLYIATSTIFHPPTEPYLQSVLETISSFWPEIGIVDIKDIPIL